MKCRENVENKRANVDGMSTLAFANVLLPMWQTQMKIRAMTQNTNAHTDLVLSYLTELFMVPELQGPMGAGACLPETEELMEEIGKFLSDLELVRKFPWTE